MKMLMPEKTQGKNFQKALVQIKERNHAVEAFPKLLAKRGKQDADLYFRIIGETKEFFRASYAIATPFKFEDVIDLIDKISLIAPIKTGLLARHPCFEAAYKKSDGKWIFYGANQTYGPFVNKLNSELLKKGLYFFASPSGNDETKEMPGYYVHLIGVGARLKIGNSRVLIEGYEDPNSWFASMNVFHNTARNALGFYHEYSKDIVVSLRHSTLEELHPASNLVKTELQDVPNALRRTGTFIHEIEHSIQGKILPELDTVTHEEGAYLSQIANIASPGDKELMLIYLQYMQRVGLSSRINAQALDRIFGNGGGKSVGNIEKKYNEFYLKHLGMPYSGLSSLAQNFDGK